MIQDKLPMTKSEKIAFYKKMIILHNIELMKLKPTDSYYTYLSENLKNRIGWYKGKLQQLNPILPKSKQFTLERYII